MAGKPQTLATTSAFEILGPVMVGPSSSHTAGALRCAQVAASLLEGRITKVTFGLWNSFAHTYRGHGTDRALVAGILGLDTDDENIKQAFDLAREQGLEYHFDIKGDDASIHPNTVDIEMVDDTGATAQVRGESLGGGKMRISRINGVGVDISGMYSTLFVAHKDVPGVLAALTNLLAYAHVNIAFCRTYRTEVGGQAYSVFETDGAPDDTVVPMLRKLDNVDYATFIELPGSASSLSPGVSAKEIFDDGEQLLDACNRVAVIDHHRRAANYIESAALNFHEPYASSASELVTELLQYLADPTDLLRAESEALLAGIVLDTKNFTMRTGGRTFEAAAFLRRAGADTSDVQRLFQSDLAGMVERYDIIRHAELVHGDIAVAAVEKEIDRVTAAKAADELLTLSGIHASVVLYKHGTGVNLSARSLGEINVQFIMEKLGGGGNSTTAGGQVNDATVDEVRERLLAAIDEYMEE